MCKCELCKKKVDDSFLDKLRDQQKSDISLLLGNGIIRAADPSFEFNFQEIKELLKTSYENEYKDFTCDCPEELLNIIRVETSFEILSWYQTKFDEITEDMLNTAREWVSNFSNLFTLNYDPITYRLIFENGDQNHQPNFNDGFVNTSGISVAGIKKQLQNKKAIYYLHGAFHIIYKFEPNPTSKGKTKHLYKKI